MSYIAMWRARRALASINKACVAACVSDAPTGLWVGLDQIRREREAALVLATLAYYHL